MYDNVISLMCAVETSFSISGSMKNDTGITIDLCGSKVCCVKQKQAILLKYLPAWTGETLYTAIPVIGLSVVF